jgi:hypothetical protein
MDAKLEIAEVNTGQRCHVICQRFPCSAAFGYSRINSDALV